MKRDTAISLLTVLLASMSRKVILSLLVNAGMILFIIQSNSYRPLSKTVRFNVIGHEPQKTKGLSNIRKQFRMF